MRSAAWSAAPPDGGLRRPPAAEPSCEGACGLSLLTEWAIGSEPRARSGAFGGDTEMNDFPVFGSACIAL